MNMNSAHFVPPFLLLLQDLLPRGQLRRLKEIPCALHTGMMLVTAATRCSNLLKNKIDPNDESFIHGMAPPKGTGTFKHLWESI